MILRKRYTWVAYASPARLRITDISGTLHRLVCYNEDAGTAGPGYDVTLVDETGADLLNGHGLARAWNATNESFPRFDNSALPDGQQLVIPVIPPLWLIVDPDDNETNGVIDLYYDDRYTETGGIV